jgi:hypothetical protein
MTKPKPRKPYRKMMFGYSYRVSQFMASVMIGHLDGAFPISADECRKISEWLLKAADYLDAVKRKK